jgi:hypothetical protein
MNPKTVFRGLIALLLVVLVSSFAVEPPAKKFTPVGTWEYSVPGVQPGYEKGSMVIAEDGNDYKVTMVLNEYSKTDAEKVVYKKKTISFSLWVETEEILVSGTFDGDEFKGSLSYFEGDYTITARRTAK